LPFALLFALGRWFGLPTRYSDDPIPAALLRASEALTPVLSPAQSAGLSSSAASLCALVSLPAIALFLPVLWRGLRVERWLLIQEEARRDVDADDRATALGFSKAALFTASGIALVLGVLLGGAVADRLWRLDLLLTHARALRGAPVTLVEAAPGQGSRFRVHVSANGVEVRNVNMQELLAVAYGVSYFAVWSDQMFTADDPEARPGLVTPRYDVRVRARIAHPEEVDTFALHQRITQFVAERFGIEVQINGRCQPPCGVYGVPLGESPL
jgi:hypothetical protein